MSGHLDPETVGAVVDVYAMLLAVSGRLGLRTVEERKTWARAACVWLLTDPACPVKAVPA